MAKKQTKELSSEERLEQAAVPEEEQPYPLPEGWIWVRLGRLTDVVGGGTPSTSHPEYYENADIPWLSPSDLSDYHSMYISYGQKNISRIGLEHSSARMLPKGTVCLSSRAPIGYVVITANELATNQGFKSFLPSPFIDPQYLYWYLKGNKDMLESMASGTTFLELSGSKAAQIKIPLPPLQVQNKISNFLNKEFQRLDEAKAQVQIVIDSSEKRKQAILHKAFTGELTEKWRKDNGHSLGEWEVKAFNELVASMNNGLAKRRGEIGTETVVLRLTDIGIDEVKTDNLRKIRLTDKEKKKFLLDPMDVLMIRVNGSKDNVGKQIIINSNDCAFSDHFIRIKYKSFVLPEYMIFFAKTKKYRDYINENMVSSAGQNTISRKGMDNLIVNIPTVDEQREIVKILNSLMAKEHKMIKTTAQIIAELEDDKKSILSKVFRGELHL